MIYAFGDIGQATCQVSEQLAIWLRPETITLVLQPHISCLGIFDLGYRTNSLRGETLPVAGRCGIQACPMPPETNCDWSDFPH